MIDAHFDFVNFEAQSHFRFGRVPSITTCVLEVFAVSRHAQNRSFTFSVTVCLKCSVASFLQTCDTAL